MLMVSSTSPLYCSRRYQTSRVENYIVPPHVCFFLVLLVLSTVSKGCNLFIREVYLLKCIYTYTNLLSIYIC